MKDQTQLTDDFDNLYEYSEVYTERMMKKLQGCSFDFILDQSVANIFIYLKSHHPEIFKELMKHLKLND